MDERTWISREAAPSRSSVCRDPRSWPCMSTASCSEWTSAPSPAEAEQRGFGQLLICNIFLICDIAPKIQTVFNCKQKPCLLKVCVGIIYNCSAKGKIKFITILPNSFAPNQADLCPSSMLCHSNLFLSLAFF